MGGFRMKRIYEAPEKEDGMRVLVDRIWPRGMSKERAQLDAWMKPIAPSPELRTWFCHKPEKFAEFTEQYEKELSSEAAKEHVGRLRAWAKEQPVTLLYAAKDEVHNHAIVLKRFLERDME
jgi:uncharacterized protein YeaO (DUF488 family)